MTGQPWLWTPPHQTTRSTGVGLLLRSYRQTFGLTQQQLAERLGFDQSYVSKVESGRRAIHDISTLRHIARRLSLSPEDVGLAAGSLIESRRDADPADPLDERIAASQRTWRLTRDYLNHHRISLARAAAGLYPQPYRLGNGLLVRPNWMWNEPVDLADIELAWSDTLPAPTVSGAGADTEHLRPLTDGGAAFGTYTRAMRDLDRPTLFENRLSFRMLEAIRAGQRGPRLSFGHTTYFDALDVCESVAHETAAAMLGGGLSWPALPFRRRIGDPFDLCQRVVLPSINTLTIRHDQSRASFMLHRRSAGSVATAGGVYHVLPAGVFQPSGISPGHHETDFDLWRNIMRELSEELLGNAEHDGTSSCLIDYDGDEPFRSLQRARHSGCVRAWCFGMGVDALTLFGEILTVVVVDADVFDSLFSGMVPVNAEGSVVTTGPHRQASEGIPFTHATVRRLIEHEPLAPSAAACLELAWRHRGTLLPGLRMRAAS
ncbi:MULTISPECIES: helix-turn-helix domain-containing protein [Protofrankia]|uniref:Helix-turn-helix domain protein n=1 Tax=Candidatus Protofrankia datiscae TaxID=2716812 RepID=F8B098_9ACTN|nr:MULTISPECIES: helix-turn-helix transcriptional regulator [Protofrankia]AEH08722.1 helix-turn-helix domain protein [Candidatus Protofrankia datiscae]